MQTLQPSGSNSSIFSSSRRRMNLEQVKNRPHATWTEDMFQLAQIYNLNEENRHTRLHSQPCETSDSNSYEEQQNEEELIRLQQILITKVRRHSPDQRRNLLESLKIKYNNETRASKLLSRFIEANYETLVAGKVPRLCSVQELASL